MASLLIKFDIFIALVCMIILLFFLRKLINAKNAQSQQIANINRLKETLSSLDSIIETCVGATNHQFVDQLKSTNEFSQLEKEEAFWRSKHAIYSILHENELDFLKPYFKDIGVWIDNRIEYFVKKLKNKG